MNQTATASHRTLQAQSKTLSTSRVAVHVVGLAAALVMATALNGAMLWQFDNVAKEASMTPQAPTQVTLATVTIVARRS